MEEEEEEEREEETEFIWGQLLSLKDSQYVLCTAYMASYLLLLLLLLLFLLFIQLSYGSFLWKNNSKERGI